MRWQRQRSERLWINLWVCALSHQEAHSSAVCCPHGSEYAPLNPEQLEMVYFLEGYVRSMRRGQLQRQSRGGREWGGGDSPQP